MSKDRHLPRLGRRGFLLGLSALATLGGARLAVAAAPPAQAAPEARLVVILLRGAMDGLHALVPYGDPAYAGLRPGLTLPGPGTAGGVLDLGGFFGLHPALRAMHVLYTQGALLPVHAVAGPYRTRSHFDGQDLLEGGGEQRLTSGWLNRALAAARQPEGTARRGLAVGVGLPLILRGPEPVGMWAPPRATRPNAELYLRMAELLHDDPLLGRSVVEGLRSRGFSHDVLAMGAPLPPAGGFVRLASGAGQLLAAPGGPRIAALEIGGWDTHVSQAERMLPALQQLDEGLAALRGALGPAWARTAVLCITEFGRTARANGNLGTDHGTAGAAFLAGGAVRGGRVLADWPGLAEDRLLENRDLRPTRDLRALAMGLLRDHLRLPAPAVAAAFPGAGGVTPEARLVG